MLETCRLVFEAPFLWPVVDVVGEEEETEILISLNR